MSHSLAHVRRTRGHIDARGRPHGKHRLSLPAPLPGASATAHRNLLPRRSADRCPTPLEDASLWPATAPLTGPAEVAPRCSVPDFYACADSSPAYEALFRARGKIPSLSSGSARTPAPAVPHSPGADQHSLLQNSIHSCINCNTVPELTKEWACPDGYGYDI